jgi:hypothetical protein
MSDYKGDSVIGNMTLDEVAANDAEMVAEIIKNSKRYAFYTEDKAAAFVMSCIGAALEYLGINVRSGIDPKFLDRIQETKQIHIETREKYEAPEDWKNGLYIYKKDILVAFISAIQAPVKSQFILSRKHSEHWCVVTNVKVR